MFESGVQPTLLMIEDSDEDYEAAHRALRKLGVSVAIIRCADGNEALDMLRRRGAFVGMDSTRLPSVILLDLNLPSIDGREVLSEIKQDDLLKSIPVVILTTSANPDDVEACYQSGANSYLLKPVDMHSFTNTLKLFCEYWFNTVVLPEALA